MTEPLFLMQRYWGSDDSDDEPVTESITLNKTDVKQKIKGKKKYKTAEATNLLNKNISSSRNKDVADYDKQNSIASEDISQISEKESPGKKKKKCKKEPENSPVKVVEIENTYEHNATEPLANQSEFKISEEYPKESTKKSKRKRTENISDEKLDAVCESFSKSHDIDEDDMINTESVSKNEVANELFPVIKDMITKDHEKVERILPAWLSNPTVIQIQVHDEENDISSLDFLDGNTKKNLQTCGIQYLFPVQFDVIPWLLGCNLNRLLIRPSDLCVSAPTGSGKTLSFVIPIVQSLKIRVVNAVRALVVLPVGDLAIQVFKVFQAFCKGTDLQVALTIGQKPFLQEQSFLVRKSSRGYFSNVDIIVSTPGRLIDHINHTDGFSLQKLQYLVIDEADRMMDEIQQGWLKKVESAVNKNTDLNCCFSEGFAFQRSFSSVTTACAFGHKLEPPLQKLLFSATLSQDPEKLHELSLYRPKLFTTAADSSVPSSEVKSSQKEAIEKYVTPEGLTEYHVVCKTTIKPLVVCHLIKKHNFSKVLCFTQSLEHSHRLYMVLNNMLDLAVRELSSSLKVVQRKIILNQFENGRISILVCSDLMARGMDIKNVDCVISYDMPLYIKTYIHRVGRTARAGKDGVAITMLDNSELPKLKRMLKTAGKEIPSCLEIANSDLTPYEESFKKALKLSSKLIVCEKRKGAILKKKPFKKQKAINGHRTKK